MITMTGHGWKCATCRSEDIKLVICADPQCPFFENGPHCHPQCTNSCCPDGGVPDKAMMLPGLWRAKREA